MFLTHLKLTSFRNYEDQQFDFHPDVNALVGMNGMGKTNVLEAIYYLCLGKAILLQVIDMSSSLITIFSG